MLTAATFPDFGLNLDADFHSKVILSVIVLVGVWLARVLILHMVWRSTTNHKVRYRWKRALSYAAPACLFLFVALVWINAFRHVSTYLGLLSAGIAIALKDLLENMAGWLFIVIRKPFAVGDRVQIGDDRGDIIDIRLFQFTILEIGNRIDAEQSTGRIIHIPNGRVFTMPQANYDQGFRYIWNEVSLRLTFDSNWQRAREILLEVLNRYGGDVVLDALGSCDGPLAHRAVRTAHAVCTVYAIRHGLPDRPRFTTRKDTSRSGPDQGAARGARCR